MFRVVAVLALGAALAACNNQRDAEWRADCEKTFTAYVALMDRYRDAARHDRQMAIHVVDTLVERKNMAKADEYLDTEWPQTFQLLADTLVADRDKLCRQ